MKAFGTAKASATPVAGLTVQLLKVCTNGLLAINAGVVTELGNSLQVAMTAILLHLYLLLQGISALAAVKLFSHGTHFVPEVISHWKCAEWMLLANVKTQLSTISNVLLEGARQHSCPWAASAWIQTQMWQWLQL